MAVAGFPGAARPDTTSIALQADGFQVDASVVPVWFSVITPGSEPHTLTVEHHALNYDYETAAAKMHAAGLPAGYAEALWTGLWPSCDVLPATESKRQGIPLGPGEARLAPRQRCSGSCWWPLGRKAPRDAAKSWNATLTRRASAAPAWN
jgi:hypothetical protein